MAEIAEEDSAPTAAVWMARGPRALEAELLAQVAALCAQARRDPRRLAHPVRIVVPSSSLAAHVGERLVAHAGRSLAGVLVQTLHGLALEALENAGASAPPSEALFPVLVRRLAAEEPLLCEALGALVDGYAVVEAAVADLLDAGFDADSAEAVFDALAAGGADAATLARAQAVVRVARRCFAALAAAGVGHRALLWSAARDALLRDPDAALPARAVLIHGFADATGLRAELIEALARYRHAVVWIDEPPDPAAPDTPDAGCRFTERLRTRLLGVGPARAATAPAPAGELTPVEAVNPDAEAREIAARVRRELDRGTRPERIGVVARSLAPHRSALRLHFTRLGIPFSGAGPGGAGPLARRAGAFAELLREQALCSADRWLDAAALLRGAGELAALRLALRDRGAVSLRDVAALEPDVRELRLVIAAARASCDSLARMSRASDARELLAASEALLDEGLAWTPELADVEPLRRELTSLGAVIPADFPLSSGELAWLLRRRFARGLALPLGGAGGGVQVLDVTQARARSFDALFLIGLVRDAFPRSVREEPLLPDRVRESLRDALPDVPLKQLGHDEERFLFAQLISASPRVTLSWAIATEEGRPCAPSSFVERLRWGVKGFEAVRARSVLALSSPPAPGEDTPVRCLREHALAAALFASRRRFEQVLPLACREIPLPRSGDEGAALADARLRVLREFEAGGGPTPRLGPYYGFVGAARSPADPRTRPLWVTPLENLSRCGWQTFVERLLRIEPRADSLEALPGSDARRLGSTIHAALAALLPQGCDPAAGSALAWPDAAGLVALARAEAARVLAGAKIHLPGLERVLALQALPFLERARALDALEADRLRITGAECDRTTEVQDAAGRARELRFRVDRSERIDGAERLTDFKTGKPLSEAVTPQTRAEAFARAVARGDTLQPVAYALAAESGGSGRLLFIHPERVADDAASFVAQRSDEVLASAFAGAVRTLLGAWDAGSFAPRLVKFASDEEADVCEHCAVAQACLQGDTGSRQRLSAWLAAPVAAAGAGASDAERAAFATLALGAASSKPESE